MGRARTAHAPEPAPDKAAFGNGALPYRVVVRPAFN